MMKVLLINTVCGKSGSVGRITAELYRYARDNQIESYVAYSRKEAFGISPEHGICVGTLFENYFDGIKSRLFDNSGFNSSLPTRKLIRYIEELKPDVIHFHNLHGYYVNIKILFRYIKEKGIRAVWTLHDCWSVTGHCAYFDYAECDKWKTGCRRCPETSSYPKAYIDASERNFRKKKEIFTSLDTDKLILVTPSVWLKEIVGQSYLKKYEIKVIENGVDLSSFYPIKNDIRERYAIKEKHIVLGVANRWERRKGLGDFFLLSDLLGKDYRFILIGVEEKQKQDLPENFIGISRTNNIKELAEFYSAADVYVNPTYEDNYPTTNMEAQACGCPVVSYDSGGSKENILTGLGGAVEKGNVQAIAESVKSIISENIDKNLLSQKARCFDKEETLKKYIALYRNMDTLREERNLK